MAKIKKTMTTNHLMLSDGQLILTTEVRTESWCFISVAVVHSDHMKVCAVPSPTRSQELSSSSGCSCAVCKWTVMG